jgi:hypothetical protein
VIGKRKGKENLLFLTFFTEEGMSSNGEVSCPWKMGKRGGVKGDRMGDFTEGESCGIE